MIIQVVQFNIGRYKMVMKLDNKNIQLVGLGSIGVCPKFAYNTLLST